ncbi:MAG: radical SAM protein [Thermoanaerobaculia bacterium]|nr:radical SAM protein [Thermoanaerobaculia bacterium]
MTLQTDSETKVNPFLHIDPERVYNPLTDLELLRGDPRFDLVQAALRGEPASEALLDGGWIVPSGVDLSLQHRLKLVSLETLTTCNQRCYFCPVSIAPREDVAMSVEMFESIVEQLTDYRETLEGVFLQSYNEPTVDRRFIDFCKTIYAADLPVAVLSNGSGFTPAKVDALLEMGPLRYLGINLSTLDRHRYQQDRGEDHLPRVLTNLDYMKDLPVATQMGIVVLGTGNDTHRSDFESIRERFAGSRFDVQFHTVMDRAGWLDVGLKPLNPQQPLAGCDNLGSRPIQHLHITPQGKCVLCCEDYDENYVVGDLTGQSVAEVLAGPELAKMRRWVYGIEEAPENFMCRGCVFAKRRA